jgi:hypothetical protein
MTTIPQKKKQFNDLIKLSNHTLISKVQNKIKLQRLDEGLDDSLRKGEVVDMMIEFYCKQHKIK